MLVQPCVEAFGLGAPPPDPVPGQCWIVGDSPAGAWAGSAGALASWTEGGWRFAAPREGMAVWIAGEELAARYVSGAWRAGQLSAAQLVIDGEQVVGAREGAIDEPDGGSVVDAEARAAIEAILQALRAHGLIDGG
ncbi:DUF2793 domain-containing protein [Sphingomonas sp. BT-65]|uniref:DUF2793 domain-containing protein n=1 Tax=Sphingomonas sp. BT-65 TaxID=2989821 RepID=UPI002236143F|nr:DUF2793 domain-containing protein [Sphingomonas sp. BT-65]MCW4462214.1 DUF2793 domain-containing protein [Sphingomonas sp. BT-65]